VEINGIAQLAPARGPGPGCAHQSRPLLASITPTLVTGSTYRLCDSAFPDPPEHTGP